MQTFLSEPTFAGSARVLDSKRLNKQLLEGRQMLNALAGNQKGFVNHPATNMWRGYEQAFLSYLAVVMKEMKKRGIEYESNWNAIITLMLEQGWAYEDEITPPWWQPGPVKNRIIASHRTSLYHKDPEHYAQYADVAGTVDEMVAHDPLAVLCCATRRQGKPCGYYWPTHVEE